MNASELVKYLGSFPADAEVFIEDSEGVLHDFRCNLRPAVFDGFDTAYDEGINLVMTD